MKSRCAEKTSTRCLKWKTGKLILNRSIGCAIRITKATTTEIVTLGSAYELFYRMNQMAFIRTSCHNETTLTGKRGTGDMQLIKSCSCDKQELAISGEIKNLGINGTTELNG